MARGVKLSMATVNAQAEALGALVSDGYLRVYDGSKPPSGDSPITNQTLLAELRVAGISAPKNGVITISLDPDRDAKATGAATWYRFVTRNGVAVLDGFIGANEDSDIHFRNPNIQIHAVVEVSDYQHVVPKS